MNKKLSIMIVLLASVLLSCSQLGSNNGMLDLYSNAEKVLISSENESSLSFELVLFSKNKIKKYEYIGLEGTNIEHLTVEIADNTIDKIKKHKYKHYYTNVFMITVTPKKKLSQEIVINKLVLNINGEANKVEFTTPIVHSFEGGNIFTHDFIPTIIPNDMTSIMTKSDDEIVYQFEAKKAIQLEKIHAKKFLTVNISKIKIGENIFDEHIQLPISIPADSMVEISLQLSGDEPAIDKLNYISTNLFFEYTTVENVKKQTNGVVVFLNPIYPILDDLNKVENYLWACI